MTVSATVPPGLPPPVLAFIAGAECRRDRIGESPARVYRLRKGGDRFFLKIVDTAYAATTYSVSREAAVLVWLQGRLAVPEVLLQTANADWECLLTRPVLGRPLSRFLAEPRLMIEAFAEAIRLLQAVPIEDCPFDAGIARRLAELDHLVERGLVAEDADLTPYPGIDTAADVLRHLRRHAPAEQAVFSHGDLGDGNVFLDRSERLHFIDLGRGGRADPWLALAFAHRNLEDEVGTGNGAGLLQRLGIADDPQRRRYFSLLDELF